MKTLTLTLAFLIGMLTAWSTVAPAAKPDDVKGWQDTYWGMTLDELIGVYGSRIEQEKVEGGYRYAIRGYKIYNKNFDAIFHWENDALIGVHLFFFGFAKHTDLGDLIEASLKSKYGKHETIEYNKNPYSCFDVDKGNVCMEAENTIIRFSFASTIIEYHFRYTNTVSSFTKPIINTFIDIYYKANQAGKL